VTYDPTVQTTGQLLENWAAVMRELQTRDVLRTNNNPVGDIAEVIVAAHYGGERGGFSQAGWDVKTPRRRAHPGEGHPPDPQRKGRTQP
jgi:hypothetical protein